MRNKDNFFAIDGGKPVRTKSFKSLPYITESSMKKVLKLLKEKRFSKFVGSPIEGTEKLLNMSSVNVAKSKELITFLGGPSVRKLEAEWSKFHNCTYSISVNSATSGLLLAILSVGIRPGDEIICTPFSFTATSAAIVQANAVPIFSDIDLDTFNLDFSKIEKKITKKTKAIMAVHWNGNPGNFDQIVKICKKYNLKLIEDASQSPGILYNNKFLGTHGDVGVFSLNEPKNIMTGEGGIVVTDNEEIAIRGRLIRNHGEAIINKSDKKELKSIVVGYNFRLAEILAEIGIQQVRSLRKLNGIRRSNYLYLIKNLENICSEYLIPQKITNPKTYAPYHIGFRWLSNSSKIHRDLVVHILRSEGIPVSQGMPRLMSSNPLFSEKHFLRMINVERKYKISNIKNAINLFENQYLAFSQIGWPNTKKDMDYILKAFKKIMFNKNNLKNKVFKKKKSFISGR